MKRRVFLGKIGKIAPFLYLPQRAQGANSRLQIAAIGVGGKGGSDLQQIARHGELIAACDISSKKLDYGLRDYPNAVKFSDYREMFSHLGDKIDLLSISTPDHVHAHAAQLAIKQGIHLFVQAPLAHSVWEVRQLVKGALESKICTQLGLQGWGADQFRGAVEYLQAGELGQIEEVHAWTNRPVWPQSPHLIKRPTENIPVPDSINWEAFIGPAERRPYHRIYQPYNWRGWRAFGSGALGDVGVHLLNLPVTGCNLSNLKSVNCRLVGPVNQETYSAWGTVMFEFNDNEMGRKIPLVWYEGRVGHLSKTFTGKANLPPKNLFMGKDISPSGCLIRGSRGMLYSTSIYGSRWEVNLDGKWMMPKELTQPNLILPRNGRGDEGLKEELINAIRKRNPDIAQANFTSISSLSEIITLGNISLLAGGSFKWDSSLLKSDRSDVNDLLCKDYRAGWEVQPV